MNCARKRDEFTYDWEDTKPSVAIVQSIAALENVEPEAVPADLGIILNDHIDPEALDQFVSRKAEFTLSFSLEEYQVQITERGLTIEKES